VTFTAFIGSGPAIAQQIAPNRTILPVLAPERPTCDVLDARGATPPALFEVAPPEGAPNVVIILIDDIGFGGPSTLGGPIDTPALDALASERLQFVNFHTTALCSPTRNPLKTGRNHHTTNTGSIMEARLSLAPPVSCRTVSPPLPRS
jgi:arylsulfatase